MVIQNEYPWAVNSTKLSRAIDKSQTKDEEDVKSIYVSFGGLIKTTHDVPIQKKRGRKKKS